MKVVLVALALVALTVAAPQGSVERVPQIVRSQFEAQPEGNYVFNFETDNGIQRQETGELKQVADEDNKPQNVVVVRGSYTYTDTEGKPQTVNYVADETGYHAEGDIIPKAQARR
ncbi:larval cuticle protein 1-like [Pectinophora gossypiella]|nr:larval cuticle protein 1-like [Pectinophora gossypiella]